MGGHTVLTYIRTARPPCLWKWMGKFHLSLSWEGLHIFNTFWFGLLEMAQMQTVAGSLIPLKCRLIPSLRVLEHPNVSKHQPQQRYSLDGFDSECFKA